MSFAPDKPVSFAAVGAGFWSRFQLAAWKQTGLVECVALCDRDKGRAEALAHDLGVPRVYSDAVTMLKQENPRFLDVITTEESHSALVHLALSHRTPVICQKPMAPTLEICQAMVRASRDAGVPFAVHENFRFQAPMRAVKELLKNGRIGTAYRARIQMISGFPSFQNQPNLARLERFILTDLGSHLFDLARYFMGEVERVFATTSRIHPDIAGEDVATALLRMRSGASVSCHMGLAETPVEQDCFPETFLFIEGSAGSIDVGPGCTVRLTTREGTQVVTDVRKHLPTRYPWALSDYLVAHDSLVACNVDLLSGMTGQQAQTCGEDNLRTMQLVFAAYDSAARGEAIIIQPTD